MLQITLKAARVNKNLTQDDVAKTLGKTKQTIVNWETGVTEIKFKDLIELSALYEIPIEHLKVPERSTRRKRA